MAVKLSNNATSTLAASINATTTTISIVAGDAARFPTLAAGDWFPVTVVDSAGNMEIMRCTARGGATLTVVRAQEGTTGKAFAAGSRIEVRLTAAVIAAFLQDATDFATAAQGAKADAALPRVGGSITGSIVVLTGNRNVGIIGTYDPAKTQQIWAMGASYLSAADGSNFGTLYGLAYKYTNNATGGTMAGGHQMVWCQNGVPYCAIGNDFWTSGNVSAYSDIRVKTNLEPVSDALNRVCKLNGYTYDRIDTGARQLGVVAQEVLEVFPELVTGDEDAYSVAYGNFAAPFIEAIKELAGQVRELRAEIEDLKGAA